MGSSSHKPLKSDESGTSPPQGKRRQILDGARQIFLEAGYERACMDHIAARAEVSKATVYHHFQDKQRLFVACALEKSRELRERLAAMLEAPSGDVERDLQQFGETFLRSRLSRDALALRRVILAEAPRFPELGKALLEDGPLATRARLAEYLQSRAAAGALRIEDPRLAAFQFIALCQGDLFIRAEFGVVTDPPEERVREAVRGAVRTFLRAYRT